MPKYTALNNKTEPLVLELRIDAKTRFSFLKS